jgi:predicted N-acetyltransferase YhbS
MIHIDDEKITDIAAREALLDRAMGAGRRLKPSERIREGRLPSQGLAFVARDNGRVIGSVRLWDVEAGGRRSLLLGPLAVDPGTQSRGVGSGLMQVALNRAELAGHGSVILVGDPEYYERFGFAADPARGLVMPGPFERRRMLGLELADRALSGAEGLVIGTGALAPAWQRAA